MRRTISEFVQRVIERVETIPGIGDTFVDISDPHEARLAQMRRYGRGKVDPFAAQTKFMADYELPPMAFVPFRYLRYDTADPYEWLQSKQSRYYFAWRASLRRNEAARGDNGYLELLRMECGVGIEVTRMGNMVMLARGMRSVKDLDPRVRDHVAETLAEGYAKLREDIPFSLYLQRLGLTLRDLGPFFEYGSRLLPGSFAFALERSGYDVANNAFLSSQDMGRLERTYDAACAAVFDLIEKKKLQGSVVLWGRCHKQHRMLPIRVGIGEKTADIVVTGNIKYCWRDGHYILFRADPGSAHLGVFARYIFHHCESRMRLHDKYRYRLRPNPETLRKALHSAGLRYKAFETLLSSGEVDAVMDAAIDNELMPRIEPVQMDLSMLDRIRRDADIVRGELTVEEEPEEEPIPVILRPAAAPPPKATGGTPEARLVSALSNEQKDALKAVLSGGDWQKAVPAGVMAQVFWEEINEIALDTLGDTVMDVEGGTLYEDYAPQLRDALDIG